MVSIEWEPESGPDEPGTPDLFGAEAADRIGMDAVNRSGTDTGRIGAEASNRAGADAVSGVGAGTTNRTVTTAASRTRADTTDQIEASTSNRSGTDAVNRIGADAENRAGSAKPVRPSGSAGPHHRQTIERRLLGLRHDEDGAPAECPVEHLLLLHRAPDVPPGAVPLAGRGDVMRTEAAGFAERQVLDRLVAERRNAVRTEPPERRRRTVIGFDLHAADLAARRAKLSSGRRAGAEEDGAKADDALDEIKRYQRLLSAGKERALARLDAAPDRIVPGGVRFLAHALAVPAGDSEEEGERYCVGAQIG